MIDILLISHEQLEADPDFKKLVDEYSAECSIEGMPPTNHDYDLYQKMEKAGFAQMLGAYKDSSLIGFLVLLVSPNAHYGCKIGSTESIFVSKNHRSHGAGLKLLKTAEEIAKVMGAAGMFVSTPHGKQFADVMEKMDSYKETNRVFFKGFQ